MLILSIGDVDDFPKAGFLVVVLKSVRFVLFKFLCFAILINSIQKKLIVAFLTEKY